MSKPEWTGPRTVHVGGDPLAGFGFTETYADSVPDATVQQIKGGFGFQVLRDEWDDTTDPPTRTIQEVRVVRRADEKDMAKELLTSTYDPSVIEQWVRDRKDVLVTAVEDESDEQ